MKFVRYGKPGKEKPGLVDMDGKIRDLSKYVPDFSGEWLSPRMIDKISKLRIDRLPLVRGRPRLGCPVAKVGNFICDRPQLR